MTAEPVEPIDAAEPVRCIAHPLATYPTCPCPRCKRVRYEAERRRWRGEFAPVTSEQAWEVVDRWLAREWSPAAMASATGLPPSTFQSSLRVYNREGRRTRFWPGTARVIVAGAAGFPEVGYIGAAGARRRVRALFREGHLLDELARLSGYHETTINAIALGRTTRINARLDLDLRTLYDRLGAVAGTSLLAVERAHARKWAPRSAWHGLDLDDPAVQPSGYPRCDAPVPLRRPKDRRRTAVRR